MHFKFLVFTLLISILQITDAAINLKRNKESISVWGPPSDIDFDISHNTYIITITVYVVLCLYIILSGLYLRNRVFTYFRNNYKLHLSTITASIVLQIVAILFIITIQVVVTKHHEHFIEI